MSLFNRNAIRGLLAFFLLSFSACCIAPVSADDDIAKLESALTKLAKAADGDQAYNPDPTLTDDAFLRRADPVSYGFFSGYKLKLDRRDGHAVVLVCDGNGTKALLEDVGCKAKLDAKHFENGSIPCEFTLRAKDVCDK